MTIKEEVKNYIEEREQKIYITDTQIFTEMESILYDVESLADDYFTSRDRNINEFRLEVERKMKKFMEFATYLK